MCISWCLGFFIQAKNSPQIAFQEKSLTDAILHQDNGQCEASKTKHTSAAGSTPVIQAGLRGVVRNAEIAFSFQRAAKKNALYRNRDDA